MSAAEETKVWSGTPSQKSNLGLYALCFLVAIALIASASRFDGAMRTITLALVLLPIGMALWRWLSTISTQYTLTDQRLILRRGVLSRISPRPSSNACLASARSACARPRTARRSSISLE